MFKNYPILSRFLAFILLPLFLSLTTVYYYLEKSLPKYGGQITLSGLDNPVTVNFDDYGTPTVSAMSDEDAYFAQGYLHASERIWQMDLQRRLVQGRTSELYGSAAVSTDIWMRTLGLQHAAEKAWRSLGEGAQKALTSYAKGVNAWLNRVSILPPEYLILGLKPEPWRVTDSLAWQKVLALDLGQNMYGEISRLSALKIVSPAQLKTFYPFDPDFKQIKQDSKEKEVEDSESSLQPDRFSSFSTTSTNLKSYLEIEHRFKNWREMEQNLERTWSLGERYAGSNSWVVSGQHTLSGAPILANDPHLSVQQTSLWYAMQMKGDKLNVTGMSIVGIPGITLGRNQNIVWGVTALMSDQQDLFYLEVPLDNNRSYTTNMGRENIDVVEEIINIRTDSPEILNKKIKPITVQIRKTEIGPIISDVVQVSGNIMALRWSALDDDDRSFESFYQAQYATNWQEFRSAVQLLKAPGLHFLYADNDGNIGSQVAGHLPIRGAGVGVVPQRAFESNNLWKGYVPFEQLPSVYNPESGVIVSANNQLESAKDIVISHEWAPMARNRRITQLINELISDNKKLTIEDMLNIQKDQVDLSAKALLPLLQQQELRILIQDNAPDNIVEMSNEALTEFSQWNAEFHISSSAASIYQYWFNELKTQIFANELEHSWRGSNKRSIANRLIGLVTEEKILEVLTSEENEWCTRTAHDLLPCQKELLDSFYSAIKSIEKDTRSSQVEDWSWGQLHHVELSHKLFGKIKLLERKFTKTLSVGGSANTVNVANSVSQPSGGYQQTLGASFRQIFDLGEGIGIVTDNGGGSAYILPTGQSGHFLSFHFDDQVDRFIKGNINYFEPRKIKTSSSLDKLSENNEQDNNLGLTIVLTPERK